MTMTTMTTPTMMKNEIALRRLRSQRLAGNRCATPEELVGWMGAVQAQDYPGAKWGVGQRVEAATEASIDSLLDAGRIVRTHVLRPTWHLVLPDDVRWLLALSASRLHAANASRHRQLELDAETFRRARALIVKELRDGEHRTRAELAAILEHNAIATRENRMGHILMHVELDGIICNGPRRGVHFTYALLDERVAATPARDRDEAVGELARRYFRSHGPATAHDFAWWSGMTVGDARRGIDIARPSLTREMIDEREYWLIDESIPRRMRRPYVHLLPNFDEHIVAYRNHAPSIDPAITGLRDVIADRVAPHIVAVDGLAIGGWRRRTARGAMTAELHLQRELTADETVALKRAVHELSRFIAAPVTITRASARRG